MEAKISSLSEELLHSQEVIDILYRMSHVMGDKTDLEEIARGLLDEILEKVPARRASVMLLEPGGELLTVIASTGIPSEFGTHPSVRVDESVVGEVVTTGKPLLINNLYDHSLLAARLKRDDFLTSSLLSVPLLVAPLSGQQMILGTINLADTLNEKGYFTSKELKLLTAVAAQAALVFQKLYLINDLKEVNNQNNDLTEITDILFSQNSLLAELHKVGMEISETDTVNGVCTLIVSTAVKGFGARMATLLLMDNKSGELMVAAAHGLGEEAIGARLGNHPDRRIIEALETGRVKYCNDNQGPLQLCGNTVKEWGLFPFKGRTSKLGVFVVEIGALDISDSIAILVNHSAMALDTLMLNERLQIEMAERIHAEAHIKVLNGLLPICCSCKKIRDDKGYWEQVEVYIRNHSEAEFSHGICPECMEKLYGKEFCTAMKEANISK